MYFRVQKPGYINIYIDITSVVYSNSSIILNQQTNKLFNISENGIGTDKDNSFTKKSILLKCVKSKKLWNRV